MFTVRSKAKGESILSDVMCASGGISYSIVDDITRPGAFDEAFQSNPPFDAVVHTASPFHYHPVDPKKDMIDPAVDGTLEVLRAIKASAPSVKRVVVTSSFAAVIDPSSNKMQYSSNDWNPITMEQALSNGASAYISSKTFAEKAAWDFVATEKPGFTLATINPVLVFGPVLHLDSLTNINTSNADISDMVKGNMKAEIKPSSFQWVDVRDVALAHALAAETEGAAGKRFITAAGPYSNLEVARIIKENFPDLADKLPEKIDFPSNAGGLEIDTAPAREVLGLQFGSLEKAVVDTVKSLLAVRK